MKTPMLPVIICAMAAAAAFGQQREALPLPEAGNVTLPLEEYDKLLELANKPVKRPDVAPVDYAIRRAELKLEAAGGVAKGTAQFDGEVMKRGTVEVPLVSAITIMEAQQKGKPLPLEQRQGSHAVVLAGPAPFEIAMDVALPVQIEAARAMLSLPAPAAGAVDLMLTVPGDLADVHLSPGLIVSRSSAGGRTTIEAALVPGEAAAIWWATRETAPPPAPREVRFLSDVKTLVTVGEADLKAAVLADVTVLQGEPAQFSVQIPAGFEVTSATGTTLDTSDVDGGTLTLKVNKAGERSHQFLVTMERPLNASNADAPLAAFPAAQRETGEVLVEGEGTMELTAKETGGLRRMDLRETSAYLHSLAHESPQAAFRFHRQPGETPALALEWVRFPAAALLAAVAERAEVTTMVTAEGRSLTEVKLDVRNQAQPFLKVALPAGASILSAEVAGEKVKPVRGTDGDRVPLLRPGYHPSGSYNVSFVFLHSGAPFARKGEAQLDLPRMDVPIALLQWEVFLPDQYRVKDFGGDAISARLLPPADQSAARELNVPAPAEPRQFSASRVAGRGTFDLKDMAAGDVGGVVIDQMSAVVSGARVTATMADGRTFTAVTDAAGAWEIRQLPAGKMRIEAFAPGFRLSVYEVDHDARRPQQYSLTLSVGSTNETIEVTASAPTIQTESMQVGRRAKKMAAPPPPPPQASANVTNLQRVAGVLPIAIEVPHSGASFQFVRALVMDEETKLTFKYGSEKK